MKKLFLALLLLPSFAIAGSSPSPDRLTQESCMARVQVDGVQIARLVEMGYTKEMMLEIPFSDEAPQWVMTLIKDWISDATKFQGSPQQWLAKLVSQCKSLQDS